MLKFNTALSLSEMLALAEYHEAKAACWAALSPEMEPARVASESRGKFWRTVIDTAPAEVLKGKPSASECCAAGVSPLAVMMGVA